MPGTIVIVDEHDWMICSKLEEFMHDIGWVTKWIHKLSVLLLVSVGQQGLPRALD